MTVLRTGLPLVAVVGRPNVGKSSLVNRVLGRREAIVEATPGVTRDAHGFLAEWGGRSFEILDTGGLEPGAEGLDARVADQAHLAIEAADVIVLVVDVTTGAVTDDLAVAELLRKASKPVLVAVNKVDDPRDEPVAAQFHRLGLGEPVPFSALHGRGSGDLLDRLIEHLPPDAADDPQGSWASVAIVGRPNVGKSSLLNALLGSYRSIVDATPGTTRDPVDSYLETEGRTIRLVDTAGMRREVQIADSLEYYSLLRSRRALARADVAILVVDAQEGVTGHEQRIAQQIVEQGRACVVALNKWDLIPSEETDRARLEASIADRLRFLPWALRVRTSALTKRGVAKLLPAVLDAVDAHRRRLPTSLVNRVVADAQEAKPHPRTDGRAARILYAVQADVGPPRFLLFCNARLQDNYLRYIEKSIRATEPFAGSPLQVEPRRKARA